MFSDRTLFQIEQKINKKQIFIIKIIGQLIDFSR